MRFWGDRLINRHPIVTRYENNCYAREVGCHQLQSNYYVGQSTLRDFADIGIPPGSQFLEGYFVKFVILK